MDTGCPSDGTGLAPGYGTGYGTGVGMGGSYSLATRSRRLLELREIRSGVPWGICGRIRAGDRQDAGLDGFVKYAYPAEHVPAGNPGIVTRQLSGASFL
jgi:hypothetical protein